MRNLIQLLNGDDSDDENEENEEEEINGEHQRRNRRIPINYIFLQMLQQLHNDRENSSHDELLTNLMRYEKDLKEETREYNAFKEIRRDFFVPEKYKNKAFNDSPLDIEELKTNLSSPHIYPKCLLLMDIDPEKNQSILDIGCGTGWFSVLAAHVGGENCSVEGWDLSQEIINEAYKNLKNVDEKLGKRIKYKVNNAFWPTYNNCFKQFDRIHVGASIPVENRLQIYNLLKPYGKLVSPIAEGLFVVTNDPEQGFLEKSHLDVRYRMLILPEKIPIWIPKLSVHIKYPPIIKEQIFCMMKIYFLRDSLLSYLPLEIIFQILSWLYRNPSNSYSSTYLNFLKQNEIQFRKKHNLERSYYNFRFENSEESDEDDEDDNNDSDDENDELHDDENVNDELEDEQFLQNHNANLTHPDDESEENMGDSDD